MIESVATITSIGSGTCYHPDHKDPVPMIGTIITGSNNVLIGGSQLGSGYVTSIVLGQCGHVGIIVAGSNRSIVNNLGKARITSPFVGYFTGIIITGFNLVSVGD